MANDTEDKKLKESLKKIITTGLGAAFMTEESIRAYLSDLKLPKDVLNSLLAQAGKSKEEVLNKVVIEIMKVISKIDFVVEASKFVEEHKFRITAEIDVVKKQSATEATTDVQTNIQLN